MRQDGQHRRAAGPPSRLPAFFGPGHDWLPDFNWGGAGSTGIQGMLLAPEPGKTGKLHLFPAWPAEWDVDFKLHAPGQALVEASLRGGKLVSLKVTPVTREKDIVNWLGKHPEWKPFTPPVSLGQGKPIAASSQFNEPGYDAKLANDGDPKTRWASDFAARTGWLEIDLGGETEIGAAMITEVDWKETRSFTLEVKQGGTWKEVARGTTIGQDKEIAFPPVRARHVRLNILEASFLGIAEKSWTTPALEPLASRHLCFTPLDGDLDRPRLDGSTLVLEIEDNGKGIAPAMADGPRHGNGLPNMQKRAAAAAGTCTIHPAASGMGTVVRLVVPLPDAPRSGP